MENKKNGATPPDRKGEGAESPQPIVVDLSIDDDARLLGEGL